MTSAGIKALLSVEDVPKQWYNILADLPEPLPPPLDPRTMQPAPPDPLFRLFGKELVLQEVSSERYINIPEEVREAYIRIGRPTPLQRATRLEKALGTPAQARIRVNFLKSMKIFDDEVTFIVTCKIAGKRNDVYTLDCVISWLHSKSFMNFFWQDAIGDRFVVRKDSRGRIHSVVGGRKIKDCLFGLPIEKVLLWFGTILSGENPKDEHWTYDDGIVYYHFNNSQQRRVRGRKLPVITIDASLNENPLNLFTKFRCTGEVIFNPRSGQIGISRKNLSASLLNVLDCDVRMKAGETRYLS